MTYIVAKVDIGETGRAYPFNCFRTDICVGDEVAVRMLSGEYKFGPVTELAYLNWRCKSAIICKASEIIPGGPMPPIGHPIRVGMWGAPPLIEYLEERGWIPLNPSGNVHKEVMAYFNGVDRVNIMFRSGGIDLQLFVNWTESMPAQNTNLETYISQGRLVRHYYSQTKFNLLEGIQRFSLAFEKVEGNYDRFFKPVGSRIKLTDQLAKQLGLKREFCSDDGYDPDHSFEQYRTPRSYDNAYD